MQLINPKGYEMSSLKVTAGQNFPAITVSKLGGGELELSQPAGGHDWRAVVVYRGKHCPICTNYLKTLNELLPQFNDLGIDVVAVSGDPEEKAKVQIGEINPDFQVGFGLTLDQMASLGLYISHPRSPQETDQPFAEPGFFIVNSDGNIQVTDISNAPFSRPELNSMLMGLKFIRNPENNYPIRGTYT